MYFLTTNPGKGMDVQSLREIQRSRSIIDPSSSYDEIANRLGEYYRETLSGAAKRRIEGMLGLAQRSGFDGVVQIEVCPFHSRSLPKKDELVRHVETDGVLCEYISLVRAVLANVSALSISAVGSSNSISLETISSRNWLNWQAELIHFDQRNAEVVPIIQRADKTTSAFVFSSRKNIVSGFILMMGSNNLPRLDTMNRVSDLLRNETNA